MIDKEVYNSFEMSINLALANFQYLRQYATSQTNVRIYKSNVGHT